MKSREILVFAEALARKWHAGQFRKDGTTPYIEHPEAVAKSVDGDDAKSVAWMHDLVEDTACPISALMQYPSHIYEAVILLSNVRGETYEDYVFNISKNELAKKVKIADIQHNLSCQPSFNSFKKYQMALCVLCPSNPEIIGPPSGGATAPRCSTAAEIAK